MTERTMCVVCRPGSKADTQPRNEYLEREA